ncbi:MAG TPA: hypothetical protein VJ975_12760, partial [Candidatus Limnocylindria bacterium]|nr:hypothetical protein [Candidatus Limnocylindria bacterium]
MAEQVFVELFAPNGGDVEAITTIDEAGEARTASGFRIAWRPAAASEFGGLEVEVVYEGADAIERGFRIGLELGSGADVPAWLIPGLFYAENRPPSCRRIFPRYERGTNDPRAMVSERWSFRADRAATPAVFCWQGGRMTALAIDPAADAGAIGIGFEGSADRTRIWVDLPYREEP